MKRPTIATKYSRSSSVNANDRARRNKLYFAFFLLLLPGIASGDIDKSELHIQNESKSYVRKSSVSSSWRNKLLKLLNSVDDQDETSERNQSSKDVERDLKSSSSSSDEGYYIDDYVRQNRDDDFYKYIGDPLPPNLLPLEQRDVIGFMLASMGVTLGSSGGIGGGGIVVPVYIIGLGMSPRHAIPLGSVTVLGGSLAGLILNLRRRHPLADRPIIDWDLILVMEPLVLVGALIGALFHRIVSVKILMVLLVLLLSVVAHTTLAKAKRMYDAEARYIEHLRAARWEQMSRVASFRSAFRASGWSADALHGEETTASPISPRAPISPVATQSILSDDSRSTIQPLGDDEKQRILILNPDFVTLRSDLLEQEKVTPRSKVLILLGKFSVLMFLNITLGGGAFRSPWGIACGSIAFWVVHVIMVAFLVASAWAAQTYLVNRHEIKEIVRFDYVHGDIKWERRTAVTYPWFFICSGLCAGMFGIGGGMITVPLMLTMGVHPAVVTATASTMVFFTAALSASSFAVFNLILWDYAIVCFCVGFFASMFGSSMMQRARQTKTDGPNFERNSLIAYCIGGVILLSALLMTMQYVLHIVSYDGENMDEGGLCEGFRI